MRVLFLNHHKAQCGIWQCGNKIANALIKYGSHEYIYEEVASTAEYESSVLRVNPDVILYNYFPLTMPWLCTETKDMFSNLKKVGISHEHGLLALTTALCGGKGIILDPTFQGDENILVTVEGIPDYIPHLNSPSKLTIGSFGFGFHNKGFHRVVEQVQSEFDEAIIKLHIPYASFGDMDGSQSREREYQCRSLLNKKGIELEVSYNYLSDQELLDWLASNSINCFFYDDMAQRGVSGTVFWAIASRRPLAINNSAMFKHLDIPEIKIENNSLKEILNRDIEPIKHLYKDWSLKEISKRYDKFIETL